MSTEGGRATRPTTDPGGTESARPGEVANDALISVRNLTKQFVRAGGSVVRAVHEIDLEVSGNEIVCLLGPSGCGKTTLLRCIAGLETPSSGEIVLNGTRVFSSEQRRSVPPERRGISMMFQSYALWPHMSVFKNVAYPLQCRRWPRARIRERVAEVLEIVGIPELVDQMPGSLSGGQQQRVALARSLAPDPSVILFDEPLSNVDAKVRESLRLEILEMHRRVGFAALYVTHDQEEAMRLADRVAVLNHGEIADIGPPARVYGSPRSRYVANFIGSLNEIPGVIVARGDDDDHAAVSVDVGSQVAHLPATCLRDEGARTLAAGADVVLGIRPESLHVGEPAATTVRAVTLTGRLLQRMFLGSEVECLVEVGPHRVTVRVPLGAALEDGSEVALWCRPDDVWVFAP